MRASLFLSSFLAFSLQLAALNISGQDIDQIEVSLEFKNARLIDALRILQNTTAVSFVFTPDHVKPFNDINLPLDKRTLRNTIELILEQTDLAYREIKGKTVVIYKKPNIGSIRSSPNESNLTGRVYDALSGEPIPGTSVVVKGTNDGTTTDVNGAFTLSLLYENSVLVFTSIGYKVVERPIGNEATLEVAMEQDATALNEVVVNAGYYDVKDKEKTGSISKVTSDVIAKQPITSPLQAMQGRMPGIYVSQYSGVPGSNFQVRIRGTNSLANGNNPLYVINGVPLSNNIASGLGQELYGNQSEQGRTVFNSINPLNTIDPNDIESIEVLRDADATAIYGSRGANGVVLITTKRGKAGKIKVDVDVKTGVSKVTRMLDVLSTSQYINMRRQAVTNDGETAPRANEYDINGTWDQKRSTNWQDVLIGNTASMNIVNASVSGGSYDTQFLLGTGFNTQGVVYPGDNKANRFSTHFSVTHASPDKRLTTRLSANYSLSKSDIIATDLTYRAITLAPNAPKLYDENGDINWEKSTWQNPVAFLVNRYTSEASTLLMNAELGYELLKGLKIKSSFGLNDNHTNERNKNLSTSYRPIENKSPADSYLQTGSSNVRSWIVEPQVSWETKVSKGRLNVLAGGTYQSNTALSDRAHYQGFSSNALANSPNSASQVYNRYEGYSLYKYVALYGRLNYTFPEKYILNLTGRRDGSSRFGPNRKFANLGAVGAAWIFSNEDFIKNNLSFLSFGKLRGSYGLTGNDQVGDYQYLDTYASGTQYQGIGTLAPNRLYNPDYGWEVNRKVEGAVELGLLNDRVTLTSSWYLNRSANQLINYQLAGTTGFPNVLQNSPAVVRNTGWEFEISTTNLDKAGWRWTTSANLTLPRNELVSFKNLESSSYADIYVIGKPLSIRKVYHYLGVNQETGLYEFEDVNSDGQLTPEDQTKVIASTQNYYGGLTNTLSYKGFQLDIFFQFVSQQGEEPGWSYLGGRFDPILVGQGNIPVEVLEGIRWQSSGDKADKQRFTRSTAYLENAYNISSSDALASTINFVRLKNVAISWQLPDKWLRGVRTRVYAQGQNLLTFTNYKGMDPETGHAKLPPLTTFVAGIQLTL